MPSVSEVSLYRINERGMPGLIETFAGPSSAPRAITTEVTWKIYPSILNTMTHAEPSNGSIFNDMSYSTTQPRKI
jgi:hypothetical protein